MKPNTIILIVATLVVAAGAYWFYFSRGGNDPALTIEAPGSPAQIQIENLIMRLPKRFDTTIFTDKKFTALVDITSPVSPEVVGRPDPFAPIPGVKTTSP